MKYVLKLLLAYGILTIAISSIYAQNAKKVNLGGNWVAHNFVGGDAFPAKVPGSIQINLLNTGRIADPYHRNNELVLQDISNKDWAFMEDFKLNEQELAHKHIQLVCEGVDTYARIGVNGNFLDTTTNMFRKWVYELKPIVKEGNNVLFFQFFPPFKIHEEKVKSLGYVLPADNEAGAYKYSPFCRKAAYHFGWDWGPRFITMGIWQDIYLLMWD